MPTYLFGYFIPGVFTHLSTTLSVEAESLEQARQLAPDLLKEKIKQEYSSIPGYEKLKGIVTDTGSEKRLTYDSLTIHYKL